MIFMTTRDRTVRRFGGSFEVDLAFLCTVEYGGTINTGKILNTTNFTPVK